MRGNTRNLVRWQMRPTDRNRAGFGEKCMCCKSRTIRNAARRECEEMVYGARDPRRMKRMQTYDSSAKRIQKYIVIKFTDRPTNRPTAGSACWENHHRSYSTFFVLPPASNSKKNNWLAATLNSVSRETVYTYFKTELDKLFYNRRQLVSSAIYSPLIQRRRLIVYSPRWMQSYPIFFVLPPGGYGSNSSTTRVGALLPTGGKVVKFLQYPGLSHIPPMS